MTSSDMARKIKELRKEKNMTLEEVANIVGVGKSTVRKWETGMIKNMKRDKIVLLAKALGTTPVSLMGWIDEETEQKNDAITDIILKLRTDNDYLEVVSLLKGLSAEELIAVRAILAAFKKQ